MPAITYSDFSGGLDRRLPITVQEAARLWVLRNAYITTGKRIAKRPGLKKITGLLGGTVGLAAAAGRLKVFTNTGAAYTPPPQVDAVALDTPADLGPGQSLQRIYYAEMYQGYLYVVADYQPLGVYTGGVSEGNAGTTATGDTGGSDIGNHVPPYRPPTPGSSL